jgi:hypothetical protein
MQLWDDWRADTAGRLQFEKAVLTLLAIAASWLAWLVYSSESGNAVTYKIDVPELVTTRAAPESEDDKRPRSAVDEVYEVYPYVSLDLQY